MVLGYGSPTSLWQSPQPALPALNWVTWYNQLKEPHDCHCHANVYTPEQKKWIGLWLPLRSGRYWLSTSTPACVDGWLQHMVRKLAGLHVPLVWPGVTPFLCFCRTNICKMNEWGILGISEVSLSAEYFLWLYLWKSLGLRQFIHSPSVAKCPTPRIEWADRLGRGMPHSGDRGRPRVGEIWLLRLGFKPKPN